MIIVSIKRECKEICERNGLRKQMKQYKWKEPLTRSLKIALAAVVSIAIAGELGLQYSATAGIITVLSIQNTKRETLQSARNRGLAFGAALVIAAVCFGLLEFTLWAFVVYLLLFALLCINRGWVEALAMDSVLITHFLAEKSMAPKLILNEVLLFVIGAGMGVLVNFLLHKKEEEFEQKAAIVDEQIKGILKRMSRWLPVEDKSEYGNSCFVSLQEALTEAKLCAAANYNNVLRGNDTRELDYIRMREQQSVVLQEIYENIKGLVYLPGQAEQVAQLIGRIEQEYHRDNTVVSLLQELDALLENMKQQPLPESREEFEARAVLFYILMQIKRLLGLKREFVLESGRYSRK